MNRRISQRDLNLRYREGDPLVGRIEDVESGRLQVRIAIDGWQQPLMRRDIRHGEIRPWAKVAVEYSPPGQFESFFQQHFPGLNSGHRQCSVSPTPQGKAEHQFCNLHDEPGTLWEGRVLRRCRGAILVDFGKHGVHWISHVYFMRTARRLCRDGLLPGRGETVAATWYGTERDGSPRLYVWDYGRDPKYRTHAAGYRSSYRGEDGSFAELPWERRQDIDQYESRRNAR